MFYRYEAYNKDKKIVRGTIEGASEAAAESILYRAGFERIISLRGQGASFDWRKMVVGTPRVSQQGLLDFTNELSIMIEAGLSLQNALSQLARQATERSLKSVISKLASDLKAGLPLHKALSSHPQVFSQTYVSMVEANEKSGTLDDGLRQISRELKQQVETRGRIQQALIQPAIIVGIAIAVIFLLVVYVLPKLTKVFKQFGAALPTGARILMDLSTFIADYKYYILLGIILLIIGAIFIIRRPAGRRYMDDFMLRAPLFGQIIIWDNTARFSRTASNLLKSGVLLPDAMNIIVRSMSNTHIQRSLIDVRTKLIQGQTFSAAISADPIFPQFLVEMIGVGESSGALENSLGTVADFYDSKTTRRINRMTGLIEPALTIVLSLGVGAIAIIMFTTIYGLMNQIK
jgi:type IV pilus assembly protein PilC